MVCGELGNSSLAQNKLDFTSFSEIESELSLSKERSRKKTKGMCTCLCSNPGVERGDMQRLQKADTLSWQWREGSCQEVPASVAEDPGSTIQVQISCNFSV